MTIKNHYGVTVDSEIPTTGVFQNNLCEWLYEEAYDGVDLNWQDHLSECPEEDHDLCMVDGVSNCLIGFMETTFDDPEAWYAWETDKLKIGFKPNPEAEYSAIVGEVYTQVIKSEWGIHCALCSPCYPGQGDANTPGDFLCYALPPEIVGDSEDGVKERIFLIGGE